MSICVFFVRKIIFRKLNLIGFFTFFGERRIGLFFRLNFNWKLKLIFIGFTDLEIFGADFELNWKN